jgi:hypothetical protein
MMDWSRFVVTRLDDLLHTDASGRMLANVGKSRGFVLTHAVIMSLCSNTLVFVAIRVFGDINLARRGQMLCVAELTSIVPRREVVMLGDIILQADSAVEAVSRPIEETVRERVPADRISHGALAAGLKRLLTPLRASR